MYKELTHSGTKTLETPRLSLRRFVPEDAENMYRNWASESAVVKYLTWPVHGSPEISAQIIADWVEGYKQDDYYQWAIVLKEIDQPIGSISAVSLDNDVRSAEIGYCIGTKWWHQGITTEALGAVIDYLIRQVGMLRVEARHDVANPNSGAVMKKCGMEYEGTLRQSSRSNQGIADTCVYSILARDYLK